VARRNGIEIKKGAKRRDAKRDGQEERVERG